jgi:hypothetical protein
MIVAVLSFPSRRLKVFENVRHPAGSGAGAGEDTPGSGAGGGWPSPAQAQPQREYERFDRYWAYRGYESDWVVTFTFFRITIVLFCLMMMLASWVKFQGIDCPDAAICVTCVVLPATCLMVRFFTLGRYVRDLSEVSDGPWQGTRTPVVDEGPRERELSRWQGQGIGASGATLQLPQTPPSSTDHLCATASDRID